MPSSGLETVAENVASRNQLSTHALAPGAVEPGQIASSNTAATIATSIVAPQRRRKAVISEEAIEARFLQSANEMFGNSLPLLLNVFLVNLMQRGFARRLPNAPYENSSAPPQEQPCRNGRRLGGGIQLTNPYCMVCMQIDVLIHIGAVWCRHNSRGNSRRGTLHRAF